MTVRTLCNSLAVVALGALLGACGTVEEKAPVARDENSPESLAARLDLAYGGFGWEDEAPGFGQEDLDELLEGGLPPDLGEWGGLGEDEGRPGDPNRPGDRRCRRPCPMGALVGHSKEIHRGMGVFGGLRLSANVQVMGAFKGIYGRGRFFGKLIDRRGRTEALMAGVTRGPLLLGRYYDRRGPRGVVMARSARSLFLGKWQAFCRPPRDARGWPNEGRDDRPGEGDDEAVPGEGQP